MAPQIITVTNTPSQTRLDRYLRRVFSHIPTTLIHKYIRKKLIKLNNNKAEIDSKVIDGDEISLFIKMEEQALNKPQTHNMMASRQYQEMLETLTVNIIYQDEHMLVINKPHGLAVQGGSKIRISVDDLADGLKFGLDTKPKLVHRLDKDTSGILLLARTNQAAQYLTNLFKTKQIQKIYWAMVAGKPSKASGLIDLAMAKSEISGDEKVRITEHGKNALTQYKLLDHAGKVVSWLEMLPITGRTHQLRVHASAIGHPIIGDGKYGGAGAFIKGCSEKLHLHAREITITDYFGKKLSIKTPLPQHMQESFRFFGFNQE